MKKITFRITFGFILALSMLLAGCSTTRTPEVIHDGNAASMVTPIPVTWKKDVKAADISGLKWIEGTWRGTGGDQEPFFERYKIEDDSALVVESFSDSALTTVTDTTRYVLVNGEFRYTDRQARRVAASEITENHIQFVPVVGGGNNFRFERQSGGKWRAVLEWPAKDDQPAKQLIYKMEPYKK